ncbi:MAG TPA: alkaline phosphatase family protein [Terriglobales bacterium]|nr:alkaline phosphatase family protein [Terriglobales bacterium]
MRKIFINLSPHIHMPLLSHGLGNISSPDRHPLWRWLGNTGENRMAQSFRLTRGKNMHTKEWVKALCASLMLAALMMQPVATLAQDQKKLVEIAPRSGDEVARYTRRVEDSPYLTHDQKLHLLRKKIKYVFVLFQENRSFDFYFGTYPGARGLFSQPADKTPGFVQPIVLTDGSVGSISPFLIPQSITDKEGNTVLLYPEDTDSVNHGHTAIDAKLHLDSSNEAQNDRYAFTEEGLSGTLSANGLTYTGAAPTRAQVQKGELVVSHVDCDTAPFLWRYADRFTLFDNFFDTVIGPSTPNAIAMIAGQSGMTQWVLHPNLALGGTGTYANGQLPVTGDPQPYWGNLADAVFQPTESGEPKTTTPASNLTFASLPLSFMGDQIENITAQDLNPAFDLLDVQQDITKIAGDRNKPVNWGWFQEGYDHESTDPTSTPTYANYIAHHNGPQYFGYEANNPAETKSHLKGLGDFYAAISDHALPEEGGVFYVRGGYGNLDGLTPRSPSPAVKADFPGNDDHPGYSDAQISEALLADSINAIANSKYWKESAIIITYDETDGLYDHTQPKIRSFDPVGNALDQGPRIPGIVISPYSVAHAISHEATEHGSIIKFIDQLFNLTPLADLPDEAAARAQGEATYGQKYLGPSDDKTPGVGNLFSAFDNARLSGRAAPLPARYAMIPRAEVLSLPHAGGHGCSALHITPTDIAKGVLIDSAPADFNPRPSTNPGVPYNGGWPSN